MKYIRQLMIRWVHSRSPSEGERYLARSVDVYDLEIRLKTLERSRN